MKLSYVLFGMCVFFICKIIYDRVKDAKTSKKRKAVLESLKENGRVVPEMLSNSSIETNKLRQEELEIEFKKASEKYQRGEDAEGDEILRKIYAETMNELQE